jgi:hypothetical protein
MHLGAWHRGTHRQRVPRRADAAAALVGTESPRGLHGPSQRLLQHNNRTDLTQNPRCTLLRTALQWEAFLAGMGSTAQNARKSLHAVFASLPTTQGTSCRQQVHSPSCFATLGLHFTSCACWPPYLIAGGSPAWPGPGPTLNPCRCCSHQCTMRMAAATLQQHQSLQQRHLCWTLPHAGEMRRSQ